MKRKISVIVIMTLVMGVLLTGCASTKLSEDFDKAEVISTAEEVITLYTAGDMETICNDKMDASLSDVLTVDKLQPVADQYLQDAGAITEFSKETVIGQVQKDTKEDYAVAIIRTKYENKSVTYTLSFNKDMKLIGFYIK